jgi:hypothetical protein
MAPGELSATSMRRPARVKPFFLVVPTIRPTADQREAQLALSLSFLERFLARPFETADRRPAGGAQCCHPEFSNRRFALLPSALFVEFLLRCQLGVLNLERVLPSRTRTDTLLSEKSFLADAAVTRTRRFGLSSFTLLVSSADPVDFDFAAVRTLHPLPTACEGGSRAFAQQPQLPSFWRACRLVLPGAAPIV